MKIILIMENLVMKDKDIEFYMQEAKKAQKIASHFHKEMLTAKNDLWLNRITYFVIGGFLALFWENVYNLLMEIL